MMWLLRLTGLSRPMLVGAAVLGLGAAALAIIHLIRADARQDLKTEIKEQNDDATIDAFRADLGYLDCVDGGFVYDFGAGECRRPARGNRR